MGESQGEKASTYLMAKDCMSLSPEYEAYGEERENSILIAFLTYSMRNRHAIVQAAL